MSRHPTVPYDVLAIAYLKAVEEGVPPSQALRQQFGFSVKASQWRREWMGRTGWLPVGDPVTDERLCGMYDKEWLAGARAMVAAKLAERRDIAAARPPAKVPVPRVAKAVTVPRPRETRVPKAGVPKTAVPPVPGPVVDRF